MPFKKSLAAAFAAVAGIAISVGVPASTAHAATSAVALPITQYSHMLVDPAHQQRAGVLHGQLHPWRG